MTRTERMTRRSLIGSLAALPLVSACAGSGDAPGAAVSRATASNVAVLLPLTGRRAALGQQMAKAIWLVEDLGGSPRRSLVLDTGDAPAGAAAAASRAVSEGASVIVGPLTREQTPAAVQAATPKPVVTLSNDNDLAALGAWVFGVTPEQSVDAVYRYAGTEGARRVALLETPGALGAKAAAALAARARRAGVAVIGPVAAGTDPGDMTGALRQAGGGALPDILYVPSTASRSLSQAEGSVRAGVTTIGSLQWSGLPPADLRRLDKACFTGPDPDRFNRLAASYQSQLEESMGVIAALAVDAVAMATRFSERGQPPAGEPLPGLLGAARFNADRTCTRALSILRIDGGNVLRVI